MRSFAHALGLIGIATALVLPPAAFVGAQQVPGERVSGIDTAVLRAAARLRRAALEDAPGVMIELPPLDEATARRQEPAKATPLRIGTVRPLPAGNAAPLDGAALSWSPARNGGVTTTIGVRSQGALGLRMSVLFGVLPDGAEVRFFSPYQPANAAGPFDRDRLMDTDWGGKEYPEADGRYAFWSPSFDGDSVAMEIWVARVPAAGDMTLALGSIGHLWDDPIRPRRFQEMGDSQECEIDVACFPYWVNFHSEAVAKYVFNDGTYEYLCTGTVMNDNDPSSYVPFFLTAAHCVSAPYEASTMVMYWNFWRAACGGPVPGGLDMTAGGAILHYTSGDITKKNSTDHTLLQLKEIPPGDWVLSGWDASDVTKNYKKKPVHGIHHPAGDLMMASKGKVKGFKQVVGDDDGSFHVFSGRPWNEIQVRWQQGVTEGGSSGSGLWVGKSVDDAFLIGVLTGGGSSCSRKKSPDYYGRFDLTYAGSKVIRELLGGETTS